MATHDFTFDLIEGGAVLAQLDGQVDLMADRSAAGHFGKPDWCLGEVRVWGHKAGPGLTAVPLPRGGHLHTAITLWLLNACRGDLDDAWAGAQAELRAI